MENRGTKVILFDGDCSFCTAWAQWVLRHDPGAIFRMASLQSKAAQRLLSERGWQGPLPDSVLLVDDEGIHVRTRAIEGILRPLPSHRFLGALLRLIPLPLKDLGYRGVAKIRRLLPAKSQQCLLLTPETRARFLDADERGPSSSSPE